MPRGFEVAEGFKNSEINLPKRQTTNAAGYDFEAAYDIIVPSIWKVILNRIIQGLNMKNDLDEDTEKLLKPTLVPTGIKAYMEGDEVLYLYNRSSNPLKRFLLLGNGVGVIDSDYYGNEKNDGHIMFQYINFGIKDVVIQKGERIGQGVFQKFLLADDDVPGGKRKGGFGHTDEQEVK